MSGILPGLYQIGTVSQHFPRHTVYIFIVVAVFRRFVDQELTQTFFAFEVLVQCFDQLIHSHVMILIYHIFYSHDGISQVGRSSDEHACCAVLGTAFLYRLAGFHASFHCHRCEDDRIAKHMIRYHKIVTVLDHTIEVCKLLLQRIF